MLKSTVWLVSPREPYTSQVQSLPGTSPRKPSNSWELSEVSICSRRPAKVSCHRAHGAVCGSAKVIPPGDWPVVSITAVVPPGPGNRPRLSSRVASWAGTGWVASRGTLTPQNCTAGELKKFPLNSDFVYIPCTKAVMWSLMS